ncbi:MAG TPA: RnfABCDGE type electron transport complex subunit D [Bacillota bacterium]|nr:RnfABCDGE type electron transport complex subunit D [Bacillota bacterium]
MTEKLYVSSSPHFRGKNSTARIMGNVLIALIPAVVAGTILFGWRVLLIIAFCNVSCVLLEYLCRKVMKRENTIGDLSAMVTGTLLALSLPVTIPLALAFFGCAVAIVVAKQFFGGLGQNFINPAVTGRVAMAVSFPSQMTDWSLLNGALDAVTAATPRAPDGQWTYLDLFLGNVNGSVGETCKIAILAGFVYLTVRRVINPIIPVLYVGSVAALSPLFGQDPLFEVLSGGLLFVAVFMATDYVTSPLSMKGKAIYAVGLGVITILIRVYASLPECVSFAVMLMNILTPHIDRLTVPKPFGASA